MSEKINWKKIVGDSLKEVKAKHGKVKSNIADRLKKAKQDLQLLSDQSQDSF